MAAVAGDGAAFAWVRVDPLLGEVGEGDVAAAGVEVAAGDDVGVEFADEVFGVAAGTESALGELVAGVGVEPADLVSAGFGLAGFGVADFAGSFPDGCHVYFSACGC
ncbi:MAG TPA: hypothetical protein VHC94_15460 [Nitrobacter sp.]|nr:hypothetical protein [Nitrobacter sp.]